MILIPQREYVYNKPVVVKGKDGMETMRTFKLKTPHQETVRAIPFKPAHTNQPPHNLTISSC